MKPARKGATTPGKERGTRPAPRGGLASAPRSLPSGAGCPAPLRAGVGREGPGLPCGPEGAPPQGGLRAQPGPGRAGHQARDPGAGVRASATLATVTFVGAASRQPPRGREWNRKPESPPARTAPGTCSRSRVTLCGARLGHEGAREGRGTRTSTRDRDAGPSGWRRGCSPGLLGPPEGPRDPQEGGELGGRWD